MAVTDAASYRPAKNGLLASISRGLASGCVPPESSPSLATAAFASSQSVPTTSESGFETFRHFVEPCSSRHTARALVALMLHGEARCPSHLERIRGCDPIVGCGSPAPTESRSRNTDDYQPRTHTYPVSRWRTGCDFVRPSGVTCVANARLRRSRASSPDGRTYVDITSARRHRCGLRERRAPAP
jgi:hypothetical protein